MSTKFPDNIQTFSQFQDMTYNDWEMLAQYRKAMADSDFATAQQALRGISKLKNKLLTNGFMNDMLDTCYAVQDFFDNRQVPDYVVSMAEPTNQKNGDLWFKVKDEIGGSYLTFSSPKPFTIQQSVRQKVWNGEIHYSTDAKKWTIWDGVTIISSGSDNKLYVRGIKNTTLGKIVDDTYASKWILTGENISCSGNLGSLLDFQSVALGKSPTLGSWGLAYLFSGQTALVSAPELPNVANVPFFGYAGLFIGTSITKSPNITSSNIGTSACSWMFKDCAKLTTPPIISATSIGQNGCFWMFSGCPELSVLPKIYAKSFSYGEFNSMFKDCVKIKISQTRTDEYANEYVIPITKDGTESGTSTFTDMFTGTGGTFVGNPTLNTTYYTSNEVI